MTFQPLTPLQLETHLLFGKSALVSVSVLLPSTQATSSDQRKCLAFQSRLWGGKVQ